MDDRYWAPRPFPSTGKLRTLPVSKGCRGPVALVVTFDQVRPVFGTLQECVAGNVRYLTKGERNVSPTLCHGSHAFQPL